LDNSEEEEEKKIIILKLLCTGTRKCIINENSMGVYLLNKIYTDFVEQKKYTLKIQPSGQGTKQYYLRWKEPLYIEDDSYLVYSTG